MDEDDLGHLYNTLVTADEGDMQPLLDVIHAQQGHVITDKASPDYNAYLKEAR